MANLLNAAFCFGLVATVVMNLPVVYIMAITFCMSSLDIFTMTADMSFIPEIVEEDNLMKANSMINGTNYAMGIAGPGLAGLLYGIFGARGLFLINGVSFILASLIIFTISYTFVKEEDVKEERQTLKEKFQEYSSGFEVVQSNKNLMTFCIFGGGLINFFIAQVSVYISKYVLEQNISQGVLFGLMTSSIAIGSLIASVILSNVEVKNKKLVIINGFILQGIFLFLFSKFNNYTYNLLILILLGFASGVVGVNLNTYVQQIIPLETLGRSMSTIMLVANIFVPLGILVAGFVGSKYHLSLITTVTGTCVTIIALYIAYRLKDTKNLEEA